MHVGGMHWPPLLLELLDAEELDDALLLADDDDVAEDADPACAMPPDPLACCDEDAFAPEPLPPAPLASGPIPEAASEHAATVPSTAVTTKAPMSPWRMDITGDMRQPRTLGTPGSSPGP